MGVTSLVMYQEGGFEMPPYIYIYICVGNGTLSQIVILIQIFSGGYFWGWAGDVYAQKSFRVGPEIYFSVIFLIPAS